MEEKNTPDYQHRIDVGGVTIFAGTIPMVIRAGGKHVRQASVFLPRFKREPVVTATVHSKDSTGTMFGIWRIEYNDLGGVSQIAFSAQNIQIREESDFKYLCSFTAIGELALANEEL